MSQNCEDIIEAVMMGLFVEQKLTAEQLQKIEVAYAIEDVKGEVEVSCCTYTDFVTSELAKSEPDILEAAVEAKSTLAKDRILIIAVGADDEVCVAVVARPGHGEIETTPGPDRSLN